MRFSGLLLVVVAVAAAIFAVDGCTVIYVGHKASKTGAAFVGHSSDGGASTDPRLVHIDASAAGKSRPIYPSPESYPRYVGYDRGASAYYPQGDQKVTKPLGVVEVPPTATGETIPYVEETYGAASRYLGIGEATCSAVYVAAPIDEEGGKALISVDELSRVAMERATSAREAIALMGKLAVEYGFYGPGSFEGSGESLILVDKNEGWVFHVLPDSSSTSAIWAAQRVPADHIAVVANMFIIRELDVEDTKNFMISPTLLSEAAKRGCPTPVDFTGCFSGGEYAHKYYSGRRVWRAYDRLAPQLQLSPEYGNLLEDRPYPFSAPPAAPLTRAQVFDVYRDHLEGTDYDMTVGPAAGPFGTPERYTGGPGEREYPESWWERPIGLFRTGDTYVVELNPANPADLQSVIWFGPHAPHGTVFQPFAPGLPAPVPDSYTYGHQRTFNRTTAFWAHRYVLNLAQIKYGYMIKHVQDKQKAREAEMDKRLQSWVKAYGARLTPEQLSMQMRAAADETTAQWWALADDLMFSYADGFVSTDERFGQSVGYPSWWLKSVGYDKYHPEAAAPALTDADAAAAGEGWMHSKPALRRVSGADVETPSPARDAARRTAASQQAALYAADPDGKRV